MVLGHAPGHVGRAIITVMVLYLVSLLFAPPILHPTDHFLNREIILFTCFPDYYSLPPPPPPQDSIDYYSLPPPPQDSIDYYSLPHPLDTFYFGSQPLASGDNNPLSFFLKCMLNQKLRPWSQSYIGTLAWVISLQP